MRLKLIVFATALLQFSAAQAQDAEQAPEPKRSSIMTITCPKCPPLKPVGTLPTYEAPEIESGVQETIVRNVDGKTQIERAEQWLGGAPVRYISRSITFMPPEAELMAKPETNVDKPDDGVDAAAKTSALDDVQSFDAQALPLRN